MGIWLRDLNATAQTLDDLYAEGKPRHQTYREMTARILDHVRQGLGVVVVSYGHPGVFVESTPCQHSRRRARWATRRECCRRFHPRRTVCWPISASTRATMAVRASRPLDFLAARRRFDPTAILPLYLRSRCWACAAWRRARRCCGPRLQTLTNVLTRAYPSTHRVTLYQTATLPACRANRPARHARKASGRAHSTDGDAVCSAAEQRRRDPRIWRWFDEA